MSMTHLSDLHELAVEVLMASKTSHENAAAVARALVKADADGIPSGRRMRWPVFHILATTVLRLLGIKLVFERLGST